MLVKGDYNKFIIKSSYWRIRLLRRSNNRMEKFKRKMETDEKEYI